MESEEHIETVQKLATQLASLHTELLVLVKKSPNDLLNKFKLKLVNAILTEANGALPQDYHPFMDFETFDEDDAPTCSDVNMVVDQYLQQLRRFHDDNADTAGFDRKYTIDGVRGDVEVPRRYWDWK